MTRFSAVAALCAAVLSGALAAPALAHCQCRANGTLYKEGAVACLRLPTGDVMARCGKVLNNTSWSKIGDGCPEATMSTPTDDPDGKQDHKPADHG